MKTKLCRRCKQVKPHSEFPWSKRENCVTAWCFACKSAYSAEWYRRTHGLAAPRVWPDALLAECIAAGMSLKETAAKLGMHTCTVRNRRLLLGLPPFKRRPSHRKGQRHPLADRVAELLRTCNFRQIADRIGITRGAVAGIVHRHINPPKEFRHVSTVPHLRPADRRAAIAAVPEFERGGADGQERAAFAAAG